MACKAAIVAIVAVEARASMHRIAVVAGPAARENRRQCRRTRLACTCAIETVGGGLLENCRGAAAAGQPAQRRVDADGVVALDVLRDAAAVEKRKPRSWSYCAKWATRSGDR
jgi:hypothetical protein